VGIIGKNPERKYFFGWNFLGKTENLSFEELLEQR